MNVPTLIREILDETGLTQAQFASKVGVSQGTISKWISEQQSPNKRQWDEVLKVAAHYPKLKNLIREGLQQSKVSIVGFIGAGAEIDPEFDQVPPEGLDQIDLPFPIPLEIIGFRVRGESMRPAYRDGDVVLVWKEQKLGTEAFVGEEVALRTRDGKRYLKEIQQGSKRGTFNLYSHNDSLIKGAQIEWVGEIYLTIKASQLRRVAEIAKTARSRK